MILDMKYYPDPILKKKCLEVKEITEDIKKLISDMIETMDHKNGVGLAANQVGVSKKILVLRDEGRNKLGEMILKEPEVYINPVLSDPSEEMEVMVEGCLSFPEIRIEVERPIGIKIEYMNLKGEKKSEHVRGFKARVLMHENDHLNGKIFTERAKKRDKKYIKRKLKELKKAYKKFESAKS